MLFFIFIKKTFKYYLTSAMSTEKYLPKKNTNNVIKNGYDGNG